MAHVHTPHPITLAPLLPHPHTPLQPKLSKKPYYPNLRAAPPSPFHPRRTAPPCSPSQPRRIAPPSPSDPRRIAPPSSPSQPRRTAPPSPSQQPLSVPSNQRFPTPTIPAELTPPSQWNIPSYRDGLPWRVLRERAGSFLNCSASGEEVAAMVSVADWLCGWIFRVDCSGLCRGSLFETSAAVTRTQPVLESGVQ
ncbi:hypothetical protein S83_005268 [Arachis hypogaea]